MNGRWIGCISSLLAAAAVTPARTQEVDYHRAELLLGWHTTPLISGTPVTPNWINDTDRFWYRINTGSGHEFTFVDPAANVKRPLFDHARLAAALSVTADTSYVPGKLPFDEFEFVDGDEGRIEFTAGSKRFECDLGEYMCQAGDTLPDDTPFVQSPDERWEAFVMDHNLFIRPAEGGDTIRLTTDGEEFNGYGLAYPRPNDIRNERVRRPGVYWSPDSRKLLVQRIDQRGVEHHHYVSYTPQRTVHYSQPYALPGDSIVPLPAVHILDVGEMLAAAAAGLGADGSSGADGDGSAGPDGNGAVSAAGANVLPEVGNIRVSLEPRPNRLYLGGSQVDSLWSADSRFAYMHWETRASKSNHLAEVDAANGDVRIIAGDSSRTWVETAQRNPTSWFVSESTDDAFWWSERDGWAHIWRFSKDGTVKNQVTSGAWAVGAIWHIDEANRRIYFTAYGREQGIPYYGRLYRIGYDGSGLAVIAGEEGNHAVTVSPSGRFVVDTYSTIGDPPVTLLRNLSTGSVVRTLEEADISRLKEVGWRAPEVFSVKARDGVTDIYGVIYFPDDLDESGSYPVIDHIYPGPQVGSVGSWTFKSGGEDFSLAKLGFVVIQLDHMGTPHRSKAFHDIYYGDFNDNGLPDHVTAIKQLAARYPFMDLDRVGIYGHSGGGFASTDAMVRFPDFFKVAVSGAGNHDNASYNIYWAEKYQGLLVADSASATTNFTDEANKTHVANLKGKLLLMHGDMDDNVHPAMTVQLIDELTKANKDYDLVWAPDRAHGLNEPYFIRRRWDYFVEHLLGAEPPVEYEITRPTG